MSHALRRALQRATALIAPSVALMLVADPAHAGGGRGGSDGAAGGSDNPPGSGNIDGSDGASSDVGGGGGGAGIVGGNGGNGGLGSFSSVVNVGGLGGTAASNGIGGAGQQGQDAALENDPAPDHFYAGGGGGGGAHGFSGPGLPGQASQGGAGGRGGNVPSIMTDSNGGGGGAGGYGAVSDLGASATLSTALTGGVGGAGGFSLRFSGEGGSGGVGLYVHGSSTTVELTIQANIQGGIGGESGADIDSPSQVTASQAGAGGAGLVAASPLTIVVESRIAGGDGGQDMSGASGPLLDGAGGAGIVGSDLAITISGTGEVSGGFAGGHAGDEAFRANAIIFTSGSNRLALDAGAELKGNIAIETGSLTFAQPSNVTVNNVISGAGALIKTYAGTLTLAGTNTYTGGTTISGGTLAISTDVNLGASSGNLKLDGGTLRVTGNIASVVSNRAVTLSANGGTIAYSNADTLDLLGDIDGPGGLTKTGPGTLTLSGASTYAGPTLINGGILLAKTAGALSAASDYTVAAGAELNLFPSGPMTVGSIAGAGSISINPDATLRAGATGVSRTFSGEISGNGALEKIGAGTLTLAGTNTYIGGTTVSAGELIVDGSIAASSLVTVKAGATLSGEGIVGKVIVQSGGVISPGHSPGSMTTGDLSFSAGAKYVAEIAGAAPAQVDVLEVHGVVTLGDATLALLGGFASSTGQSFTIIDNDGTDTVTGTFAGLGEGTTVSFAGRDLKISYEGGTDGNDVVLTDIGATQPSGPATPAITIADIKAAHLGVLGLTITDAAAAVVVSDIDRGSYSFDGYVTRLIDQADTSTLPAVIVNALLTGVTPTQSHLPELGAFSTSQFEAYREAGSINPGLGPYEALGLGFSATTAFQGEYGALTDTQFLATAYQDVFGRAASAAQIAHFEAQMSYFEGLYTSAGQSTAQADLHARGAVIGQMIGHAVLDEPQLHSFDDAAIAFLRAAAVGQAHYGEPLAMI